MGLKAGERGLSPAFLLAEMRKVVSVKRINLAVWFLFGNFVPERVNKWMPQRRQPGRKSARLPV